MCAALAEEQVGRVHVVGGVDGLHAGRDAKLRQPRQVGGVDDLHVLDAVRHRRRRGRLRQFLEDVEHHAVGSVADGMHADREAQLAGLAELGRHLFGRRHVDAQVVGFAGLELDKRLAAARPCVSRGCRR